MMAPNTDLLRVVSKYDTSGRPRPGHFPSYRVPSEKKRRGLRRGLVTLFQFFLTWTRPRNTLMETGHR
ncbi:hypothetical protein CLV76_107175 [Marivita geojedonensis]|nr:hypothetical protein CLV76_107175 [Marivita geojedonensis]